MLPDELKALDGKVEEAVKGCLQEQDLSIDPGSDPSRVNSRFLQHLRFRVSTDSVIRGVSLNRSKRLCDGGAMMTSVGTGQSYTHFIKERGVKSARTAKEAESVDKLRNDVKAYLPSNKP